MSHRERDDTYEGEILRTGSYRAVICKDNIQWIIQRGTKLHGAPWRGVHYCTTKAALIRLWADFTGDSDTILNALPDKAKDYQHEI